MPLALSEYINRIEQEVHMPYTKPPSYSNTDTIVEYTFYGDGEHDFEQKSGAIESTQLLKDYRDYLSSQLGYVDNLLAMMEIEEQKQLTEAEEREEINSEPY